MALSLGLPSFPAPPLERAQPGAVIAIPDATRATAAVLRSFWRFCMRPRRDKMRHWRPGHFVSASLSARDDDDQEGGGGPPATPLVCADRVIVSSMSHRTSSWLAPTSIDGDWSGVLVL